MAHARRAHSQLRARSRSRRARSASTCMRASLDSRPVALHLQQAERRRRLFDIPQQLPEERLVFLPAHSQPCLCHRFRNGSGAGRLSPLPTSAPGSPPASFPTWCGPPSGGAAAASSARTHSPVLGHMARNNGACRTVDPVLPRIEALHRTALPASSDSRSSPLFHLQLALAATPPARAPTALPTPPPSAACRAGRSPPAKPAMISFQPAPAVKPQLRGDQVGIAFSPHQVMKQDPLLQWRQRIDVLHILCSSRHPVNNPFNLFLVNCTSGSISGVITSQPAGIRFGGTSTSLFYAPPSSPAPPPSDSRTALAHPPPSHPPHALNQRSPPAANARPARRNYRAVPRDPASAPPPRTAATATSLAPIGASYPRTVKASPSGAGKLLRSSFPFGVSGSCSRHHDSRGHHIFRQPLFQMRSQLKAYGDSPLAPTTYATSRFSPGSSSRAITTASPTAACSRNTASISPSSIRYPRIFT